MIRNKARKCCQQDRVCVLSIIFSTEAFYRLAPPIINVGNFDAQRHFLDVRDVANAYALVMEMWNV
jgi:nucleoside-diphosphate-sugar epimerase